MYHHFLEGIHFGVIVEELSGSLGLSSMLKNSEKSANEVDPIKLVNNAWGLWKDCASFA